jgi:DNA-binding CsgD family transcriptional regulator
MKGVVVRWCSPVRKIPENTLSFRDIVTLRRLRDGDRQIDIARMQGVSQATISAQLRKARQRFGVDTNEELLALPRVLEQLDDSA